jgi:hypothetical protein
MTRPEDLPRHLDRLEPPPVSRSSLHLPLPLHRRQVLVAATGLAAGGLLTLAPQVLSATAATTTDPQPVTTTPNGWPVLSPSAGQQLPVQGSDARVRLRPGPAATVLLHVLRRYHYEVQQIGAGDVIGYRADQGGAAGLERNQLSGTAVNIHPGQHPRGARGTLSSLQVMAVRDILADGEGTVRWGGDQPDGPAEGFFQIDVPPSDARLARVAARIEGWTASPGQGAGILDDVAIPQRRVRAVRLQQLQQARAARP